MLFCVALRVRKTSEGLKRSPGKASKVMAQSARRPCRPDFFVRCREKQSLFVCYLLVIIIFAFMMNEAEEVSAGQDGTPLGSSEASAGQNGAPLGSSEASAGQNGAPFRSSEVSAGQNGTPLGSSEASD